MKTSAERSLTVKVEGDELVIRIGVDTLAFAFETSEENEYYDAQTKTVRKSWKIVDKHRFAKCVINAICEEKRDGSTPLTLFLDVACVRATEADMGVEVDGQVITYDMLDK
jgi:hypothetical protein